MNAATEPLRITPHQNRPVVALAGDLVATSVERIDRTLGERLERGSANLVLDGSALSHVDTVGFAALVVLAERFAERGGRLVMAELPSRFDPTVVAIRLDEAVTLARSVEAALDDLPE